MNSYIYCQDTYVWFLQDNDLVLISLPIFCYHIPYRVDQPRILWVRLHQLPWGQHRCGQPSLGKWSNTNGGFSTSTSTPGYMRWAIAKFKYWFIRTTQPLNMCIYIYMSHAKKKMCHRSFDSERPLRDTKIRAVQRDGTVRICLNFLNVSSVIAWLIWKITIKIKCISWSIMSRMYVCIHLYIYIHTFPVI